MAMPTSRKKNEGKNSSRGKNLAMHKPLAIWKLEKVEKR